MILSKNSIFLIHKHPNFANRHSMILIVLRNPNPTRKQITIRFDLLIKPKLKKLQKLPKNRNSEIIGRIKN